MKKAHPLNRRDFLKSGLASLGFLATDGLPVFAVSPEWNPKKKPNLIFGVVSDTHMRSHYDGESFYSHGNAYYDDQALVEVMKLFKKEGVDAILHCGDITDGGMLREMRFYKEAWDKVYGSDPRPANLMIMGNHDVAESDWWAMNISHSKDPAVYRKVRLGPYNLKEEMERIWGEPYDSIWHKAVKGYHFFGFGWPSWPEGSGKAPHELMPYKGWFYHDTPDEGKYGLPYHDSSLHLAELVRREREAGRLDSQKPFFVATHAFYGHHFRRAHYALRRALGLSDVQLCNAIGFHGHGHGSDAYWRFSWDGDASFPHVMCSTLAYWKGHNSEGDHPRFARGFGDGTATGNMDFNNADHALLVRVYDDMVRIGRIWVNVKPKHMIGSLGPDWVMPLNWGTYPPAAGCPRSGCPSRGGNGERGMSVHPLREENYVKVIGSPEFPKGAKLDVSLLPRAETQRRGEDGVEGSASLCLRVRIPKSDGNPDSRIYGFNVVVAGEDGTKVKKSVYARGYCMGMGYEPNNGITELEIPQAELPPGKKLIIAVRPCSSLATRDKPLVTTYNIATGMSKSRKVGA